jgi:cytochrome c-type biogenesis protein CcmH
MTNPTRRRPVGPTIVVLSVALLLAGGALLVVALRPSASPQTMQARVRAVGATLRCPVCQDLSVADSPSQIARDMRAEITSDLRSGMTPDQIRAVFVKRYGDWILLSPPRRGIGVLVWLAPALLLLAGVVVAGMAIRRWTVAGDSPGVDPASNGFGGSVHPADPLSASDRRLLDRALAATDEEPE